MNHFNGHLHDVAWREKLTAITAQIGAHDLFVGFSLDVNLGVEQAVPLEFTDDIGEAARTELYLVVHIKYLPVPFLHALKYFTNALLYGQLAVRIGALLRGRVKLQGVRDVPLILYFAEYDFEQLKKNAGCFWNPSLTYMWLWQVLKTKRRLSS